MSRWYVYQESKPICSFVLTLYHGITVHCEQMKRQDGIDEIIKI